MHASLRLYADRERLEIYDSERKFSFYYWTDTMDFVVSMTVTRANHPDEEPLVFSSSSDEVHEYELEEHEPFHINVQTSETNPPAKLDMTVGDVNINDQFNILVHPVQFGDDSSSLIGIKYTVTAEGVINVDHSYRSGFQVVARVADEQASVGFKVKFSGCKYDTSGQAHVSVKLRILCCFTIH